MYRIGFIIEQMLGHVTHGRNLQANVAQDPDVHALWGLPRWDVPGWRGALPNWTVRAGLQSRDMVTQMQREAPLDALFFHTQVTAVLAQKWLRRIPSVVSLDATPEQYDSLGAHYDHATGPGWLERTKWRLNRDCFQAARHLVTWSNWAKTGLLEGYQIDPESITVIPPGVPVQAWTRPQPRRLHAGPVKILFVGANLERKGGLVLLEAFRALRAAAAGSDATRPTLELHLVTRTAVDPEPGVFVHNDIQPNSGQLQQLYWDSDIFCLPTFGDCLPLVLAEAGAAALPLVSTSVAAIPEIAVDGETGLLVPPGDVAALQHALGQLAARPELRLSLGANAAALVGRDHDASRSAVRVLALLKQIANQPEPVR